VRRIGKCCICHQHDSDGHQQKVSDDCSRECEVSGTKYTSHGPSVLYYQQTSRTIQTDEQNMRMSFVDSLVLFFNAARRVRLLYCRLKILLQAWRVIPTHRQQIMSKNSCISYMQTDCHYNVYTKKHFNGQSRSWPLSARGLERSLMKCLQITATSNVPPTAETTVSKHWRHKHLKINYKNWTKQTMKYCTKGKQLCFT